jgi:RND family efflux transporter MFP subunit
MDHDPLRRLLRSLRQLAETPGASPSDAELLERFCAGRDAAAFELLLWRHGPMVLATCRRLLTNPSDAEDAFQATWLVFVRKAGSVTRGQALGAWLHRVACRVALRLRAGLARRARRERPGAELLAAPAGAAPAGDLQRALDEELDRLPARQRAAFILCCMEGKTGAEAARCLGCAPGTVSSRLTRARERLRRRLARRGLAPGAAALTAASAGGASAALLPGPLVASTVTAALSFASGEAAGGALSGQAVPLAEGALRAMSLTQFKLAVVLLLVVGAFGAGAALTRPALEAAPPGRDALLSPLPAPGLKPGQAGPASAVAVGVVRPRPGGLDRTTRQPCTVQAFSRVDLSPEVPGVLRGLSVDIGDRLKRGQVLAKIDAPQLALGERQAAAALRQARGQVREAEARVAGAKAEVHAARSAALRRRAELDAARAAVASRRQQYQRLQKLREEKSIDQRLVDEKEGLLRAAQGQARAAEAAVEGAKADLAVRQSKVVQAEAALEAAQAGAEAAAAALERARLSLSQATVRSPFDGVVTRRNVVDGDRVRPDGRGGPLPLLTVQRTDPLRVVVQVPGRDAALTAPGTPVELTLDALPGRRFTGLKVARVAFAVDEQTRAMRAEVDVPNPKQELRPGMYGAATILLARGRPDALRVPASALVARPAGKGTAAARRAVYVVRGGHARLTPVRVGAEQGGEAEVLAGLRPTDRVVADPRALAGESVPVKVRDERRK